MKPREYRHSAFVKGMYLLPLYFLTFLLFLSACTSIDCPVQNRVYTLYDLKKADGTNDTLTNDTLWVWSQRVDGTDTVISRDRQSTLELNYFHGSKAYSFELPISYTQPEDVLYMLLRNAQGKNYVDTVRIKKENIPHFESVDCQAAYFHEITSVTTTHNIIDSIVIKNPNVSYGAKTAHFYIYFKADR